MLKKLLQQAEGFGWKMDKERSGADYFVGYKNIGSREYEIHVGIGDTKIIYVSVEG